MYCVLQTHDHIELWLIFTTFAASLHLLLKISGQIPELGIAYFLSLGANLQVGSLLFLQQYYVIRMI